MNLAIYQPGLAQDNQGGVYPRWVLENLETLFRFLSDYNPPYQQGTCYAYSNLGWSLLAMAALGLDSRQPGTLPGLYAQQLAAFCSRFSANETRLFSPELKPLLPRGHTKQFEALPPRAPYLPTQWPHVGAGGVISCGADMMQFLLYNMGRLPGGLTRSGAGLSAEAELHLPFLLRHRLADHELRLVPRQACVEPGRDGGA